MKATVLGKASFIARTIRIGLAMVIPILFIGSVTVLLNGFPVQAYQDFLDVFLGGALRSILLILQVTTVGILAVYMTIALNVSYMNQTVEGERLVHRFGSLLGCLTGFFILVGFFSGEPDLSLLSGQGVFSALLSGIIGSALYQKFGALFKTRKSIFVDGSDSAFNAALYVIKPFLCVILCFAVFNYLITACFNVASVQHLFMNAVDAIFLKMHRSYFSGLLFIMLISIMWWFGIHGNNVLNQVAEDMFSAVIPGEIVSKSFIDTFVIMGGTGCMIGLLISMMIFGKRSSTKKLSRLASIPCFFNISELLVFGFPVIYNPLMLLPFIVSPLLCYTVAFLLTKAGFMPEVATSVIWTTPPLLSGYLATGSVRGVIVQLLNILISTACYTPFVILYEKRALDESSSSMDELINILKNSGETDGEVILTECGGGVGRLARLLVSDLQDSLYSSSPEAEKSSTESPLLMEYRARYDDTGKCVGEDAILRWDHIRHGVVSPQLVTRLARESGDLYNLETYIIEKAVRDSAGLRRQYGEDFRLCVEASASTLYDERFESFLQSVAEKYMLRAGNICIDITGEPQLITSADPDALINKLSNYGYMFSHK